MVETPRDEKQVIDLVRGAQAGGVALEICGFRSKREAGRHTVLKSGISTSKISGITLYEPNELVISARAGTSVEEIEHVLARNGQDLPFEPANLNRIFGKEEGPTSIGAVLAMNISGPRRIFRGAARDLALGVRAVTGRGELVRAGGRVMKNVTGVDLVRGLSGSWGTLAVLTEVTFKVLPRARESRTLLFPGLTDEAGVGVMSSAMGTPYEVSGTIHLHEPLAARLKDQSLFPPNTAITALRIEGSGQSLTERFAKLRRELSPFGENYELDNDRSAAFWADVRAMSFLSANFECPLWRVTVAPSSAPLIVRALSAFFPVKAAYEWSGGLLWLEFPPSSNASVTELRRVLAEHNADSMLMRAPRNVREAVDVFHPLPFGKMKLVQAIKAAFDPDGLLNPGRMYAGV